MSASNELGISPALLQAITHTISTKQPQIHSLATGASGDTVATTVATTANTTENNIIITRDNGGQQIIKVDGKGMEGISQAISAMGQQVFQSGNTIFVVQNAPVEEPNNVIVQQQQEEPVIEYQDSPLVIPKVEEVQQATATDTVIDNKTVIHQEDGVLYKTQSTLSTPATSSTQNMSNVISVIASQISEQTTHGVIVGKRPIVTETVVHTAGAENGATVVQEIANGDEDTENTAPRKLRVVEVPELNPENGTTIILNPGDMEGETVYKTITTDQGAILYRTARPLSDTPGGPGGVPAEVLAGGCPVCGDRVSGYHYGIYSCESCKGFFKRTVQNKKAFICHRNGECAVNIANRKKCPACRFKRCLLAGMKLEAIREDRMRGGRSSYDGCSPHRTVKIKEPRPRASPASSHSAARAQNNATASPLVIPAAVTDPGSTPKLLQAPKQLDLSAIQPQTPSLLEDLMAVESLMTEEEEEQACCEGKMAEGDDNLFGSLLHFADHCLYKIVRWARNLPDFASISTDDQIVLLQNCWAELLCLCCCWKSIRCPAGRLKLAHGRTLTLDQAALMGIKDEISRMVDFSDGLRRLETDNYEFVALKALLLFSPDVKNLKDEAVIRRLQDRLTESLMIYTTTNSPKKASKFCELLARLPELTRACVVGKEQLNQRQVAGEVPQYSLLSELLKGDLAVS